MSIELPNPVALDRPNYPLDAWRVAGTSAEVGSQSLQRWILGLPVVLYRGENGQVVALDDRWAPLSLGVVHGNEWCKAMTSPAATTDSATGPMGAVPTFQLSAPPRRRSGSVRTRSSSARRSCGFGAAMRTSRPARCSRQPSTGPSIPGARRRVQEAVRNEMPAPH